MQNFEALLEAQKRAATGQRAEMLGRDLTGTRSLMEKVLIPALPMWESVILEHEIVSLSGVRIYIDVFCPALNTAFECDGYVAHGESLTRDRFTFERMRTRTFSLQGIRNVPFSYDELEKKPEMCRRVVFELLGRYGSASTSRLYALPVNEREVLRFAMMRNSAITLAEACECLQLRRTAAGAILHRMAGEGLLFPLGTGTIRHRAYRITDKGKAYFQ